MVVLFIDSLSGGGAQRQLVNLACGLARSGVELKVLTYRHEEQLAHWLKDADIQWDVVEKRAKLDFHFALQLYRYFRDERPTAIVSYLNTPNFWARILGMPAGVSRIITSERNIDMDKSSTRVLLEKMLYRFSSRIVVNANAIKELLIGIGVPADKIVVIYNGTDTEYFSPRPNLDAVTFRKSFGVQDDEVLFVLPGRIMAQKNHMGLVRALAKLKSVDRIKLFFAGNEFDQVIKQELVRFLDKKCMRAQVIFAGPQKDMPLVYSAADFVVLPSLWEGLPNVVLESMACCTPVIVSDVADNSLIVDHGQAGFVFRANDDEMLAKLLLEASSMTAVQKDRMGLAARDKITSLFGMDSFIAAYRSLLA